MRALIVIDVQNEFSTKGKRPIGNFNSAIKAIALRVAEARNETCPIAWVRHHNKPTESPAFQPGTWGAQFIDNLGPESHRKNEAEFLKDVYGTFTGTSIDIWLKNYAVSDVLLVGFYTHGCLSTTAREAIMRGYKVFIDPDATGACDITHDALGRLPAEKVKQSALLHLTNMGAEIALMKSIKVTQPVIIGGLYDLFW